MQNINHIVHGTKDLATRKMLLGGEIEISSMSLFLAKILNYYGNSNNNNMCYYHSHLHLHS